MTLRERTSLILLTLGVVCSSAAAYGYGGWRLLAAVAGVILLLIGVLLGLDAGGQPEQEEAPMLRAVRDDAGQLIGYETIEDGVQRG